MRKAYFFVFLLGISGMARLFAADGADADDPGPDLPVVLSASRLHQSIGDAPASISVIDRQMIANSGARKMTDLLYLIPGFVVGYLNGNSPVAAYHGLSDSYQRRMQVLVDGVSVYSPLYGGVEWGELPFAMSDIDRIEVVRGPNAASYGANAFLGVVNIITREPAVQPGIWFSLNSGGDRLQDVNLRAASGADNFRYSLSAGQRADRGFASFHDSSRINYLNMQFVYRLSDFDEIVLRVNGSTGNLEEGFESSGTNLPHTRLTETQGLQLRWTKATGSDDEFWVQFAHQGRQNREAFDLQLPGFNRPPIPAFPSVSYPLDFGYETARNEIEFQKTQRITPAMRAVFGGQHRHDGVRSRAFFNKDDWMVLNLGRLFGTVEWRPIDWLLVQGGAMFETNSIAHGAWSPRVSATLQPVDGHSLRFGFSRARRTPSIGEDRTDQSYPMPAAWLKALAPFRPFFPLLPKYWQRKLNGPLLQNSFATSQTADEQILSREVAYVFNVPDLAVNGEIRWFSDQLSGLIVAKPVLFPSLLLDHAYDFANADAARQRGVEMSLRWRPFKGTQIAAVASRLITESTNVVNVASGPKHTFGLLATQSLPFDSTLSVGYYRVGDMSWLGTAGNRLPAYDAFDFRLATAFSWGSQRMELAWVAQQTAGKVLDQVYSIPRNRVSFLQASFAF